MAANTPQNNARHQREFGERMKEQGLVKRCFWVKNDESLIKEIIGGNESPNFGMVMKELSPKIKGQFDGKMATELVKKIIGA